MLPKRGRDETMAGVEPRRDTDPDGRVADLLRKGAAAVQIRPSAQISRLPNAMQPIGKNHMGSSSSISAADSSPGT